MKEYKKVLVIARERLENTINGNPRYRVQYFDTSTNRTVTAKTKSDCAWTYGMFNHEPEYLYITTHTTKLGNVVINSAINPKNLQDMQNLKQMIEKRRAMILGDVSEVSRNIAKLKTA